MMLKGDTVFHKLWYFLVTYVLTLKRFDLFLQGSLLIVILLETNVYLLLKRDAVDGHHSMLVEDWVMMGSAGIEVLLGTAVAWWGRGRRQMALSGWLAITSAAGLLVLAFPFAHSNPVDTELCKSNSFLSYTALDSNVTGRTVTLVFTALLCILTKVSIWSHGLTYLDDHDPQNGPYFYGILISIRLSLGLSGINWLRPSSTREDWWEAHVSICMLTFMFAVLFTLFPTRMKSCSVNDDPSIDTGFCASVKRIVHNKALITQTLGISFLSTAVFCFVQYDRAYVQARFHVETIRQDPRTSRTLTDIFRTLVIIFFVMIFRVRFSARRIDGVKANTASRVGGVVALFVAVFFAVLAIIGCNTGNIAGVGDEHYQEPNCSRDCGIYHNCSCGSVDARAVRGSCALMACQLGFSVYQVIYTVMLAVSGASFLMQGMVVLRAVHYADKPVAMGGSFAVVALLSSVFGHLLYLMISHLTCAFSSDGSCLLHHQTMWSMGATSSLLALLAAVTSLLASRMIPEPTTEL